MVDSNEAIRIMNERYIPKIEKLMKKEDREEITITVNRRELQALRTACSNGIDEARKVWFETSHYSDFFRSAEDMAYALQMTEAHLLRWGKLFRKIDEALK